MIGIIASTDDVHASHVLSELRRLGTDAIVLDTGAVPAGGTITSWHTNGDPWRATWSCAGASIDLTQLRAVWWRRPQPHVLHDELHGSTDRQFAYSEVDAAVRGLWACTDATWVNDPERDLAASRKLWQLKVAAGLGLRIPRTCATTNPLDARAFLRSEVDGAIYKPFGGSEDAWAETRLVEQADIDTLEQVRFAPVIFQELIPGGIDIRVTVVGREVHAAEIRAVDTAYEFDFRMDCGNAPIHAHELPPGLVTALHRLMDHFGLLYGAIDLRLAPDGDYVFLEINPAGQWLFVELATGQPISAAMAVQLHRLDVSA
ncbi:MAG TPA: hypothetical protein VFN43_03420 [Humibacillus sp.]|nr:hypothetical protein [Humibacillus sp.]